MDSRARFGGVFTVLCHARDGLLKWQDTAKNLVVTTGLQYLLDTAFAGSAAATFYVGLVDDTPTFSAANTMSNRAGWTEFTEYTGNRQEYVDVRTNQTISNTASKASFPITGAGGGVGGAFLNTGATGSAGTLLCGAALTGGNRVVATADTVTVTYTFTAADDGA